jgi:hypothetical protein
MNFRHNPPPSHPLSIVIIAVLATIIALGGLTLVSVSFLGTGHPFEQAVAAERACADRVYVSERERCMQDWIEAVGRSAAAGR